MPREETNRETENDLLAENTGGRLPAASEKKTAALFGFRFFRRILLFLSGCFVLAFGVVFMAKSNLGITPANAAAYVISRIFSVDHGLSTAVFCCLYVILQIFILGKGFRPWSLLQIGVAVIFGWFISLNNRIASFPPPETYAIRFLFMLGGIVIIGFGIFLYLGANLLPHPAEGLLLAIQQKTRRKLHNIKIAVDCGMVALAVLISLIASGNIIGIREGSILAMFGIGRVMGFFTERFGAKLSSFLRL